MIEPHVVNIVLTVAMGLFSLAMTIYAARALTSRNLGDAVLAIDVLTVDLVVLMTLVALYHRSTYLLIGVIPLASWILLLDIAVAKYLEKVRKK